MSFSGFSRQTVDFLAENRLRNSRDWFHAHRDVYEMQVLAPFRALVEALSPAMLRIDPLFTVEPKVGRTISRVFRDVRRVHDGLLFRDEMWITFMRDKHCYEGLPGFYFSLGPDGIVYGYGYYMAPTDVMRAMREMLLRGEPAARRALEAYAAQDVFALNGACYARPHYLAAPPALRDWLERRTISFDCADAPAPLAFSPGLVEKLSHDFSLLGPVHAFFCEVDARRPRRAPQPPAQEREDMF